MSGHEVVSRRAGAGRSLEGDPHVGRVALLHRGDVLEDAPPTRGTVAGGRSTDAKEAARSTDAAAAVAADPVSVVAVVDRSGSMDTFGYVDVTRQTSRQFVDLLGLDDSVGVVSFGDTGREEYPGTGAPRRIVDQSTRDAAVAAVDAIDVGGCTFMGAGIEQAGTMLAGAGPRRAVVLLSDGHDNKGCEVNDPTRPWAVEAAAVLPVDLPVHTCAMGPASDQALLARLADDTGGRYYYMPAIDDLFEIYNYVRGQVTGDAVIVNESSTAPVSRASGWVDGRAESVTFSVAWHDASLRFVPRDPRGERQIAVRLRTPGGRWLPRSATEFLRSTGNGYVTFTIQDPEPGRWVVEVTTHRSHHTPYTVGGFVRSPLRVRLEVPNRSPAGQPLTIRTSVRDRLGGVDGAQVTARVAAPVATLTDLVATYRDRLPSIRLPRSFRTDGPPDLTRAHVAQLVLLRERLWAEQGTDILARRTDRLTLGTTSLGTSTLGTTTFVPAPPVRRDGAAGGGRLTVVGRSRDAAADPGRIAVDDPRESVRPQQLGVLSGTYGRTTVAGSYSVAVTATGHDPVSGTRFVRKAMACVAVVDAEEVAGSGPDGAARAGGRVAG